MKERTQYLAFLMDQAARQDALFFAWHKLTYRSGKPTYDPKTSDWYKSKLGAAGEVVVGRFLSLPVRLLTTREDIIQSVDFVTAGGLRIEVKTTEIENRKLVVNKKYTRPDHADIYVMAAGDCKSDRWNFQVRGWLWSAELLDPANVEEMETPVYSVEQKDLRTIWTLKHEISRHNSTQAAVG